MAYKFSTGSVDRGDIYYEDDAQRNTYLDWNEDALGVVAGGATNFVVSASSVGIGTASPTHEFEVYPDEDITAIIGRAFVGHSFNNDAATFGHYDRQGSHYAIYQNSSGLTILNTGASQAMYFRINNSNKAILDSSGQFGIGTTDPTAQLSVSGSFDVSGSQAGNLATTEINITLDETHFMLVMEGEVGVDDVAGITASFPAANTCPGRIYHLFNQTGLHDDPYTGGSALIQFTGGDTIDGSDHLELNAEEGNRSISLVSNGNDSWLIFGLYSESENGE